MFDRWWYGRSATVAASAIVSVKAANAQPLAAKQPIVETRTLAAHRLGGVHKYYFDNLGGSGQAGAGERKAIADAFGSFDIWETEFRRIGAGLGGGSGWVMLGLNLHTHQLENYWLADHAHGPAATLPLLVMDMYEHSYQMDYGAAAAKYIDAFFKNIQWEMVAKQIETARHNTAG